jgi:hypothetical protein
LSGWVVISLGKAGGMNVNTWPAGLWTVLKIGCEYVVWIIGVTWLVTLGGGGGAKQPWVLGS